MSKKVRHIWARPNQHIKVHRRGYRRRRTAVAVQDDGHMPLIILGAIIVFLWLIA